MRLLAIASMASYCHLHQLMSKAQSRLWTYPTLPDLAITSCPPHRMGSTVSVEKCNWSSVRSRLLFRIQYGGCDTNLSTIQAPELQEAVRDEPPTKARTITNLRRHVPRGRFQAAGIEFRATRVNSYLFVSIDPCQRVDFRRLFVLS